MKRRLSCLALLLLLPAPVAAEWQIKPFVGLTFGGGTTLVDVEHAAGKPNVTIGVSGLWLGEVFGIEGDFARAPGFFQTGDQQLLLGSSVTTLTGSVVIALPRRIAEYSLRPYFVAGAGLMHSQIESQFDVVQVSSTLPALNIGGGATGFLNERVGVSWEIRRFQSFGGKGRAQGNSFGDEKLSFWRLNMAVAFRY